MSHISKIELEVTDVSVLSQACKRLGLTLIRGRQTFKWYGRDMQCNHAIQIPGADYEIGIIEKQARFELSCDFFDRNLKKAIGAAGGLLKQAYAIEKATIEARKKGYRIIEKKNESGIRLRIQLQ